MSAERVLWINPSGTDFAGTSVDRFAERLTGRADVIMKGLEVWGVATGEHYDMRIETDAVARIAEAAGPSRHHLFGFSAGGTVALAAALALGDAILSVAVRGDPGRRGRGVPSEPDNLGLSPVGDSPRLFSTPSSRRPP